MSDPVAVSLCEHELTLTGEQLASGELISSGELSGGGELTSPELTCGPEPTSRTIIRDGYAHISAINAFHIR